VGFDDFGNGFGDHVGRLAVWGLTRGCISMRRKERKRKSALQSRIQDNDTSPTANDAS